MTGQITYVAEFTVEPLSGRPGDTINVSGRCLAGPVPAGLASARLFLANGQDFWDTSNFATPSGDGKFDFELLIPLDIPADKPYKIAMSCVLEDFAWDPTPSLLDFTLLAADAPVSTTASSATTAAVVNPPPPTPLPETGPATGFVTTALLLVAAGAAFIAVQRRRRRVPTD